MCGADENSAHVTSRLEFWRHPDLMANWPFAHDYEMTYRLAGGVLEVSVTVTNRSADPMPVALGFHPYFQLPGVPIEEAVAHIPVRRHVETDSRLVATGETTPVAFTGSPVSLKDQRFDDGFTDLVRDPDGRAVFSVEGRGKKIEVAFGPRYQVADRLRAAGPELHLLRADVRRSRTASISRTRASTPSCRPFRRAANGRKVSGSGPSGF